VLGAALAVGLAACGGGGGGDGGAQPASLSVGKFAYVANQGDDTISVYSINADTGALTAVGAPVAAGSAPRAIAVDPFSRFVYVANSGSRGGGGGDVAAYRIQPNGSLSLVSTYLVGDTPRAVAVNPNGSFVYVAAAHDSTISTYSINATTGGLTFVASIGAGHVPNSIVIHGQFAYVTNGGDGRGSSTGTSDNTVAVYGIDAATGKLTGPIATYATGVNPRQVAVNPLGTFAYVANGSDNNVSIYGINANGTLTSKGTAATGGKPWDVTIDPSGKFVYVANYMDVNVSAYSINLDGTLADKGTTATGVADMSWCVAVDPSGKFVYAGAGRGVSVFSINADGSLTDKGLGVVTGTLASAIAIAK
jgi:6-phosphogluconolactonase (cycloisomerase 2 family)